MAWYLHASDDFESHAIGDLTGNVGASSYEWGVYDSAALPYVRTGKYLRGKDGTWGTAVITGPDLPAENIKQVSTQIGNGGIRDLHVRSDSVNDSAGYYGRVFGSTALRIYKHVVGTDTLLASIIETNNDGDIITFEVTESGGTYTLTMYRDGVLRVTTTNSDNSGPWFPIVTTCFCLVIAGVWILMDIFVVIIVSFGTGFKYMEKDFIGLSSD